MCKETKGKDCFVFQFYSTRIKISRSLRYNIIKIYKI